MKFSGLRVSEANLTKNNNLKFVFSSVHRKVSINQYPLNDTGLAELNKHIKEYTNFLGCKSLEESVGKKIDCKPLTGINDKRIIGYTRTDTKLIITTTNDNLNITQSITAPKAEIDELLSELLNVISIMD